jgi:UDP-N-acetylmuramoyl-L-alanyl-D-glutamate--2,6-diaminopimelate ligase
VITSDNPRSENPLQIIQMIREGIKVSSANVQEIPDRAAAILTAIRHADARDVVLVAGKGHETTQEIGDKRFDFSDQEHIRLAAGGLV